MKSIYLISLIILLNEIVNTQCFSEAAINISNIDSHNPIYYLPGILATEEHKCYVQLYYNNGISYLPIKNLNGESIFQIGINEKPGYFDGDIGIIPGLPDNSFVELKVYAWQNENNKPIDLNNSMYNVQAYFSQATGHFHEGETPEPALLNFPILPPIAFQIPESSSSLSFSLGALILCLLRKPSRGSI